MRKLLVYFGGLSLVIWGIFHLSFTNNIII
jgi:hypothetical protein